MFRDPGGRQRFNLPLEWAYDVDESTLDVVAFRSIARPLQALKISILEPVISATGSDAEWRESLRKPGKDESLSRFSCRAGPAALIEGQGTCQLFIRGSRVDALAALTGFTHEEYSGALDVLREFGQSLELRANVGMPPPEGIADAGMAVEAALTFPPGSGEEALMAAARAFQLAEARFLQSEFPNYTFEDVRALILLARSYLAVSLSLSTLHYQREAEWLLRRASLSLPDLDLSDQAQADLMDELERAMMATLAPLGELGDLAAGFQTPPAATSLLRARRLQRESNLAFREDDRGRAHVLITTAIDDCTYSCLSALSWLKSPAISLDPSVEPTFRQGLRGQLHNLLGLLDDRRVLSISSGDLAGQIETTRTLLGAARLRQSLEATPQGSALVALAMVHYADSLVSLEDEASIGEAEGLLATARRLLDEADDQGMHRAFLCLVQARIGLERRDPNVTLLIDRGLAACANQPTETPDLARELKAAKAQALLETGDLQQAMTLAQESMVEGAEKLAPPNRLRNMARLYKELQKDDLADQTLDLALRGAIASSPQSEEVIRTLNTAAEVVGADDQDLRLLLLRSAAAALAARRAHLSSEDQRIGIDDAGRHRKLSEYLLENAIRSGDPVNAAVIADQSRARTLNEDLALEAGTYDAPGWEEVSNSVPRPQLNGLPPREALRTAAEFVGRWSRDSLRFLGTPDPMDAEGMREAIRELSCPALMIHPAGDAIVLLIVLPSGEVIGQWSSRSFREVQQLATLAQDRLSIVTTTRGEGLDLSDVEDEDGSADLAFALSELWRALLEPAEDVIGPESPLVIAPFREFALVPYHLLTSADGKPVVERRATSITPSLATLRMIRRRSPPRAALPRKAFIAGDPVLDPGLGLDPLRHAEVEARGVKAALLSAGMPTTRIALRVKKQATEGAYRTKAEGCGLVHLSCHAALKRPAYTSPLYFTPSGRDDGRLLPAEVAHVKLDEALVFLAACQTALGRPTADGMIGLGRAFIEAGARAVAMSLWRVADVTTEALSRHFYEALLGRENPLDAGQALRSAMLATRDDLRASRIVSGAGRALPDHPSLWAPFVIQGDPMGIRYREK